MSLETALKENTEVMKELIAALTALPALPVNAETPTKKEVKKEDEDKPFNFDEAVAYAYFFTVTGAPAKNAEVQAREYVRDDNTTRIEDIDALRMALFGIPQARALSPLYVAALAAACFKHWEELPTIALRREFAEKWIATPAQDRVNVKPDVKKENKKASTKKPEDTHVVTDISELRKTAQQHVLQLCKEGKREQAVELLKSFNADKLGALQDTDVSAFITRVEALLGG